MLQCLLYKSVPGCHGTSATVCRIMSWVRSTCSYMHEGLTGKQYPAPQATRFTLGDRATQQFRNIADSQQGAKQDLTAHLG